MPHMKAHVILPVLLVLGFVEFVEGDRTIRIDDVLRGIEGHRSRVHDIEMEVVYQEGWTKEGKEGLGIEAATEYNRVYRLARRERSLFYERLHRDDQGAVTVVAKGVYDGEVHTGLDVESRSGGINRREPWQFLPGPLAEDLLTIEGHDYCDYLRRDDVDKSISAVRIVDGDRMIELHLTRAYQEHPSSTLTYDYRKEHVVTVNASRGFWPVEIRSYHVSENYPYLKPGTKELNVVVAIDEIIEDNGCFYPRRIRRDRYGPKDAARTESIIYSTTTLDFQSVAINSGIPLSRFELDFPPGTQFLKHQDPAVYFVDPDETIRDLTAELPYPYLPQSHYTKEEAEEILRAHRARHIRTTVGQGSWRRLVGWVSLGLLSLALGRVLGRMLATRLGKRGDLRTP